MDQGTYSRLRRHTGRTAKNTYRQIPRRMFERGNLAGARLDLLLPLKDRSPFRFTRAAERAMPKERRLYEPAGSTYQSQCRFLASTPSNLTGNSTRHRPTALLVPRLEEQNSTRLTLSADRLKGTTGIDSRCSLPLSTRNSRQIARRIIHRNQSAMRSKRETADQHYY